MKDLCTGTGCVVEAACRERQDDGRWVGSCRVCGACTVLTKEFRSRPHVDWLARNAAQPRRRERAS